MAPGAVLNGGFRTVLHERRVSPDIICHDKQAQLILILHSVDNFSLFLVVVET